MKVFGKKLLICLLVFVLLFNFTFQPTVQASVGDTISGILDVVGGIADGIAGILTYPIKIMIMIGESAILGLLTGIAVTFGYVNEYGEIADSSGNAIDHNITFFTPDVIFFNKILLTDANIFNIDEGMPPTIKEMRTNIALWYYIMRIIAISILLAILIFIAIRMAISTVASDKAKYKEMLVHWASSIALVFILHYVIVIVCNLNSSLVKILHSIYTSGGPDSLETGIGTLLSNTLAISFTASWSSLIVVGMIIIQTLAFLVYYIKRMLTLSFLVIISPLITITYSIDKLGDGKAQALNTWLKEFFFTIIIQPFHCIIYMVFLSMAISALNLGTTGGDIAESVFGSGFGIDSLIGGILAILCIKFVWDAEKIVKNIFGIRVSESLGDAVASAAVAGAVVSKGMGMAKGAAGAAKGAKNLAVKSGLADKLGNTAIGKKVSNLGKGMTVDGKLANVQNKLAAERAKGNATDWSKVNALEDKQRRLKDIQAGKGIRGKSYKAGKSIKGAAGSVKTGVGKVMNSEGGQIFKRYVASSAGVAAAVMGSSMTYGASDKTSLFEAGVAGIGAYTGIKGGVLGLMNRKKENYMDQTQSNAAVVCNATGKDPATMTSADVARMAMNATVKDSMGDFKNLKDDRGKAEKNIIAALQDKDRAQLKRDNPNLSDDEIDDAIANKDYKSVAANVMQDIDNGIYFKNLDCDKIAANYNLEPSALRGAAGDYAEARALKNMATDNANLDAMSGQEGYHAAVLQAFAGETITESITNTQTSTESQTSTETQTSTEHQTSTENNNQTTQPQTINAAELAREIAQYINLGNGGDENLDNLKQLLGNNPADFESKIQELNNGAMDSVYLDKSKQDIDIVEIVRDIDSSKSVDDNVQDIVRNIKINHNVKEQEDIVKVTNHVKRIVEIERFHEVIESMNKKVN